ncbi:MAG: SDR family oxidoreductase [Candidatus Eisenbacteria bacterium]|nr:SDR family oxidoreductase [Candidatus Eisenbacteria bacterium]
MILVTGASEGIGYECARALLERTDATVLITGRGAEKLQRARDALSASTGSACTRSSAIRVIRAVDELLARLAAHPQVIEGAILAVGVNPRFSEGPRKLHALSDETIETTIQTNCAQTLRLSSALLGRFRRQRAGVLVWIGSQAARIGLPGAALYGATKAFLSGLAVATHREYAGAGVRVHLLHPGMVRTPRTAAVADAVRRKARPERRRGRASRAASWTCFSPATRPRWSQNYDGARPAVVGGLGLLRGVGGVAPGVGPRGWAVAGVVVWALLAPWSARCWAWRRRMA